jgi:ferritin-like metal-binding protein YciE
MLRMLPWQAGGDNPAVVIEKPNLRDAKRSRVMEMTKLQDLYVDELRDLLNAENQIIKALPKMAKNATSPQLQKAFQNHLVESRTHVERLNKIFENMGQRPKGKKCKGVEGILEEGKDFMDEADSDEVMDAGLIASAQRVEHYEMAAYGTVRTYAQLLGDKEAARLLQQTLDEEGATDKKLTELAMSGINVEAQEAQA